MKIVKRVLLALFPILLFAPLFMGCDNSKKEVHHLSVSGGAFMLDTSHFTVASAEMDYARHPRGYWDNRLKQLKELGVNTVMVRVPWTLHEPQEGVFDFTGANDVREFCRLAADNGLLVWLHIGPYTDEYSDMGGMPWWLLAHDNMKLRTQYKPFMDRVGRFYRAVGEQLADMQLSRGGTIALVQIEEPVALEGNIKGYLTALCDSARSAGFDETILTVASSKENLHRMPMKSAVVALLLDENVNAMERFTGVRKIDPNAPILSYGISRNSLHKWGEPEQNRNMNKAFMRFYEVFEALGSQNFGGMMGGTSFGHLAGAAMSQGVYIPYATSFDNCALINEAGCRSEDYATFHGALRRSATKFGKQETEPRGVPLIMMPMLVVDGYSSLYDSLPQPLNSDKPLTFEQCGMGFGAIIYETTLPKCSDGARLVVNGIHDNAQLFAGGKAIASLCRMDGDTAVALPSLPDGTSLRILVDAMGRVGNVSGYKDYKGITGDLYIEAADGTVHNLSGWNNYPLPAEYARIASRTFLRTTETNLPGYYRAKFKKPGDGDFYLYMGSWGRGEVWINGHSLGRFWNRGPRQSLYVPGCWLNDGDNELLVVDWCGPDSPVVEGFKNCVME